MEALIEKWQRLGAKVDLYKNEKTGTITLARFVFDEADRCRGMGTQFMNELVEHADSIGAVIVLSPSSDFGGSVTRLKKFYKRFGFIENKGKNKDYSISETMYRPV